MVKKELPMCSQLCKKTQYLLSTTVAAGEQFNERNFTGNTHNLLALQLFSIF